MAGKMFTLLALTALTACGNETVAETTPIGMEAVTISGTWESPDNPFKWQLKSSSGHVVVHGWDHESGLAFGASDMKWNGEVLTFKTVGPTEEMGEVEYTFTPVEGGERLTMAVHAEGEAIGEKDWEMTRVPGTGPPGTDP